VHSEDIETIQLPPRPPFAGVFEGDLPHALLMEFSTARPLAWDIETDGLDWSADRIATCQLYKSGGQVALVRIDDRSPENLIHLLAS